MGQSLIKFFILHLNFLHKLIRIYIINFIGLKTMSVVNSRITGIVIFKFRKVAHLYEAYDFN